MRRGGKDGISSLVVNRGENFDQESDVELSLVRIKKLSRGEEERSLELFRDKVEREHTEKERAREGEGSERGRGKGSEREEREREERGAREKIDSRGSYEYTFNVR